MIYLQVRKPLRRTVGMRSRSSPVSSQGFSTETYKPGGSCREDLRLKKQMLNRFFFKCNKIYIQEPPLMVAPPPHSWHCSPASFPGYTRNRLFAGAKRRDKPSSAPCSIQPFWGSRCSSCIPTLGQSRRLQPNENLNNEVVDPICSSKKNLRYGRYGREMHMKSKHLIPPPPPDWHKLLAAEQQWTTAKAIMESIPTSQMRCGRRKNGKKTLVRCTWIRVKSVRPITAFNFTTKRKWGEGK